MGLPIRTNGLSFNNFRIARFLMVVLLKSHGCPSVSQVVKSKLQPPRIPILLAISATRGGLYTSATWIWFINVLSIVWLNWVPRLLSACLAMSRPAPTTLVEGKKARAEHARDEETQCCSLAFNLGVGMPGTACWQDRTSVTIGSKLWGRYGWLRAPE